MLRILFVDDEQKILDGLRRMLRSRRGQWTMLFASGAEEALGIMAQAPVDVLVTDIRMPGMDGPQLLEIVQAEYPETVRFVLSGHAELEAAMRSVPVAHQFLSKPCDPAGLSEAIERACRLRSLLSDPRLQRVVGEAKRLPARPEAYARITRAVADPHVEIEEIAAIIESDVVMSAKLFQLVNSAFFGLPRKVYSIREAVAYLGLNMIRDLVLGVEVFRPGPLSPPWLAELQEQLQVFSTQTGALARRIAGGLGLERRVQDLCFIAGVLHELGVLVLATHLNDDYETLREEAARAGRPFHELERERLGASHAEIGAYLLGLWGLPYPVIEAAAFHHAPSRVPESSWGELGIVHVAAAFVEARRAGGEPGPPALDLEYLKARGMLEHLERWSFLADLVIEDREA